MTDESDSVSSTTQMSSLLPYTLKAMTVDLLRCVDMSVEWSCIERGVYERCDDDDDDRCVDDDDDNRCVDDDDDDRCDDDDDDDRCDDDDDDDRCVDDDDDRCAEVRKLTEVLTRLFNEPHLKVLSLFIDTLIDIVSTQSAQLRDWLPVILPRLLTKSGADAVVSLHPKMTHALTIIRSQLLLLTQ